MRVGSFRWWFEHRETGRITVAQFPNLPLWIVLAGWIVRRLSDGAVATVAGAVSVAALLWWAGDEIVRGVNPWRRLLGVAGVAWVVLRLVA